ncbi:MAG: CRTAC1 family protein [Thermoanaerobaculia bacterium]|nr:CRTAC1 family protein [Thermoanaerobaculia bacterium]
MSRRRSGFVAGWLAGLLVGLLVTGAGFAAEPRDCGGVLLRELAPMVGLDFVHVRGASGEKHLPETMGAGVAWLDYDGDGWLDLYLVQSGPFPAEGDGSLRGRLYRNLDGRRLVDVGERAGARHHGYGQGVLATDLDGDRVTDLVVSTFEGEQLLAGGVDGAFRAAADRLVVSQPGWSSSVAAADADGDGDLDLYVTRYVEYDPAAPIFCGDPESGEREYCDPSLFRGAADRFYVNDAGRFVDRTAAAGLAGATGRGLGVVFTDLDGDRRADLYVANDLTPNHLFRNAGGGRFEDVSLLSGAAVNRDGKPEAGMGIAVGEYSGDAAPDLLVTNFDVETNTFYRAVGGLAYEDVSAASGFGTPSFNHLAFGIVSTDLDGDGVEDVYVANGHIFERPARDNVSFRQPDQVLLGDGRGGFRAVRCAVLEARPTVARGLAAGDFDNDGDADLAVQENGGPARLLGNATPRRDWLGVHLVGRSPNTEGVGARLTLEGGERTQRRWVVAGSSYQSTSDRRMLFARAAGPDRALEIEWPSGRTVRFVAPPIDGYLVVPE